MPDPIRTTISATELPALLGASPYLTKWMLYRRFANGDDISKQADSRMDWGKKLEPLVIARAAEELHIEVIPNADASGKQVYERRNLIGCTRDATAISPTAGPGALETKCVFDYRTWMREWAGGKSPPRHYEIQLQAQMFVGDGEQPYKWGTLAAWVAGEMKYFKREPIPDLWDVFEVEAADFFDAVRAGREPPPSGEVVEMPLLARLLPVREGDVLVMDNIDDKRAADYAERCAQLEWHTHERLEHEKGEKKIKAELLALAAGHEIVQLPYGIQVKIKQSARAGYTVKPTTVTKIDVFVPNNVPRGNLPGDTI